MSAPSAAAIEAAARVLWSARMGNCPWEDAGRTQTEFRAYAALILEAAYAVDAPASVARWVEGLTDEQLENELLCNWLSYQESARAEEAKKMALDNLRIRLRRLAEGT